jgi:hypothetical protein
MMPSGEKAKHIEIIGYLKVKIIKELQICGFGDKRNYDYK